MDIGGRKRYLRQRTPRLLKMVESRRKISGFWANCLRVRIDLANSMKSNATSKVFEKLPSSNEKFVKWLTKSKGNQKLSAKSSQCTFFIKLACILVQDLDDFHN